METLASLRPRAWHARYDQYRVSKAPCVVGRVRLRTELWRQGDDEPWSQLAQWYRQRQAIRTQLGLRLQVFVASPWGICHGTAMTLIRELQRTPDATVADALQEWQQLQTRAFQLSVTEVFRRAIDLDRRAGLSTDEPQQWLDKLYPVPYEVVTLRENHLAGLRHALEARSDVAIALRCWKQRSNLGGHTYLIHYRCNLETYEFLDTTTGYGLYCFNDLGEFWEAVTRLFNGSARQHFHHAIWRLEHHSLSPF